MPRGLGLMLQGTVVVSIDLWTEPENGIKKMFMKIYASHICRHSYLITVCCCCWNRFGFAAGTRLVSLKGLYAAPVPLLLTGAAGFIRLSKLTNDEFSPRKDCGDLIGFFDDNGSISSSNDAVKI